MDHGISMVCIEKNGHSAKICLSLRNLAAHQKCPSSSYEQYMLNLRGSRPLFIRVRRSSKNPDFDSDSAKSIGHKQ